MTYTQIAIFAVAAAVIIDLFVFRTRLVRRRAFWVSYAIIFFFQLITNGMFTGFGIVQYDGRTQWTVTSTLQQQLKQLSSTKRCTMIVHLQGTQTLTW